MDCVFFCFLGNAGGGGKEERVGRRWPGGVATSRRATTLSYGCLHCTPVVLLFSSPSKDLCSRAGGKNRSGQKVASVS